MNNTPDGGIPEDKITGGGTIMLGGISISTHDPHRPENTMAVVALRRARMYEAAMLTLIAQDEGNTLTIPTAHLAGFAVEIGLKSYLFTTYAEDDVVKVRHDLVKAWNKARGAGLKRIPDTPPPWLERLNDLHKKMLLRYPHREIGVLVIPNRNEYQQGIADILDAVAAHVRT